MTQRSARATLEVASDEIDLERWLFEMSDADYQACARGHRAAGSYRDEHGRGTINVESIGGNLIIQHYRAVRTERSFVEMHSTRSRVYLLHLLPVPADVRWTLEIAPRSQSTSELTCTVEVTLRPLLSLLGRLMASGMFLRRHVEEETPGFARDISRKRDLWRSRAAFAS